MEVAIDREGKVYKASEIDSYADLPRSGLLYCPQTKKPVFWASSFVRKAHTRRRVYQNLEKVVRVKETDVKASFRCYSDYD